MTMTVRPVSTALGAEIRGLDLAALDTGQWLEVEELFGKYRVLVFRDQELSRDAQIHFARRFGAVTPYAFAAFDDPHPEMTEIVKLPDEVQNFGSGWHMDMSYEVEPPLGTVLYGVEVPEVGGDTLFANLHLAWLTLSPAMRAAIESLRVVHESWSADPARAKGMTAGARGPERRRVCHPLVGRCRRTGVPFLWLSPFYAREIEGMTPAESAALLGFLNAHATRPEHTCRIRWEPKSVTIWDNRVTIHDALEDDFGARLAGHGFRRVMRRVVVTGPHAAAAVAG